MLGKQLGNTNIGINYLEYPNGKRESESVDLSKIHKLKIQETPGSNEELPDEVMICGNVAFADAKGAELAKWRNL